ncbi:MAG: (2Fe-2S)-binding protein [Gammaproteobacteria bacterium]|nr:(2Fe-2S)-binding protein [Gammaproteobacteria bacterium]
MATVTLSVDGESHTLEVDADMPLLYALRDDLGKNNPRFGCGLAQCGACTVLIDGTPVRSCVLPVTAVNGEITTLNGLGSEAEPHPVQQAFIDEQVPFCGYCTNGWVMYSVAMLENNPEVTDAEMRRQFAGLKCRCGSHTAILRAVKKAADTMKV